MADTSMNGMTKTEEDNYILNALNFIDKLNESAVSAETKCALTKYEHKEQPQKFGCEVSWDSLLCWPYTPPASLAELPCFKELNGIRYDDSQNASRWCWPNGTWDTYSNYSACHDLSLTVEESDAEVTTIIYLIGYIFSLVTLVVAVYIFLRYKELRCLRNNIHTNLMFTYILSDLMWILTAVMQVSTKTDLPTCIMFFSLLHYFQLTNFFWMFVEGLYLYLLVVKTFSGDGIKLRVCMIIGWGLPAVVIAVWGISKSFAENFTSQSRQVLELALWKHCPWMTPHSFDWFYQVPTIVVLSINVIFLFMIMWVLITKLRSANNAETQQYRKATKALLVLIPLLGITYILVLAGPTTGQEAEIFSYLRAILLSSQGLSVALFYCFLNSEVQNTMRHHLSTWSSSRKIKSRRRFGNNRSSQSTRESVRLHGQPSVCDQKKDSTASESTTVTVVVPNSRTALMEPAISTKTHEADSEEQPIKLERASS